MPRQKQLASTPQALRPCIARPKKNTPGVYVRLVDRQTKKGMSFTIEQATLKQTRALIVAAVEGQEEHEPAASSDAA